MHEAALEIDGNRARARWSAPGQVLLPVLTQSGRECWPMLLADAGRSVVTDEDAVRVARGEPGRVVGDFLHGLGTSRRFEAGGLTVDAAEALRLVLLAVKRRQPPRAETALGFPAYLDDTGATEAARAADQAGWRVQLAMPTALAWWGAARSLADSPGQGATMRRRWWLVVEADCHGVSLTGLRVEGSHGAVSLCRTLRSLGGRAWFNRVQAALADGVIRRCRRDPRALPGCSSLLAARVAEMADQEIPYGSPLCVELTGEGWNCRVQLSPDELAVSCRPLVAQLAREAESWRPRLDELGAPGGVVLPPSARLPGVEAWARDWCARLGVPLAQPAQHVACDTMLGWLGAARRGTMATGLWRQATALGGNPAPADKDSAADTANMAASLPVLASAKNMPSRQGYFEDMSDLNLTEWSGE